MHTHDEDSHYFGTTGFLRWAFLKNLSKMLLQSFFGTRKTTSFGGSGGVLGGSWGVLGASRGGLAEVLGESRGVLGALGRDSEICNKTP